ncbi:UNVERIFIED_CONTAM: hypothetical protein FKN15_033166 [Acipenser sinensis]
MRKCLSICVYVCTYITSVVIQMNLDSIDGKHARRTQSSSPLGELFDHGLDSWATSLFTLSLFSVFGLAAEREVTAYTLYSILCVILVTFLLSHWEKYNTGVLYLPWGYDISQITLTAVYLLSAVVGVEAWYRPLPFGYFFTDILIAMVIAFSNDKQSDYAVTCVNCVNHVELLKELLESPVVSQAAVAKKVDVATSQASRLSGAECTTELEDHKTFYDGNKLFSPSELTIFLYTKSCI